MSYAAHFLVRCDSLTEGSCLSFGDNSRHRFLSGEVVSHRRGLRTQGPRSLAETLIAISSLPPPPRLVQVPGPPLIAPWHEIGKLGE